VTRGVREQKLSEKELTKTRKISPRTRQASLGARLGAPSSSSAPRPAQQRLARPAAAPAPLPRPRRRAAAPRLPPARGQGGGGGGDRRTTGNGAVDGAFSVFRFSSTSFGGCGKRLPSTAARSSALSSALTRLFLQTNNDATTNKQTNKQPSRQKNPADALKVGGGLVEAAADFVPASVPRPAAKAGVALVGVALAFWLLQKVVSTVLTLALLGGGLYLYLSRAGGGEGEGESKGASSRRQGGGGKGDSDGGDDDADDDPLAEARRIMSKYTK